MVNFFRLFIFSFLLAALPSCVTHNYENDSETPVVESDSTNNDIAMTRISLAMGYLKMGKTEQAKINLEKAKRFAPNLTQVYTAFAHYYDSVGEPKLSIESYDKALSINPKDADTLNNYGVFLCRQEEYAQAEEKILKAIAIPSYIMVSQSYENLALCQLKAHQFDKAETYLDKSIQHSPSRTSSLIQMARLQYIKADYKNAQTYIKRYERAARNFSSNALALAYKVNQKMHQRRIAKNYAGMLVKMFPHSYEAKQYLLNELSTFEADEFADIYRLQQIAKQKRSANKKVVILSPNKTKKQSKANKTFKVPEKNVVPLNITKADVAKASDAKYQEKSQPVTVSTADNTKDKDDANEILPLFHVMEAGDNLFSVSREYNIHMKALEKWNNISRNTMLKIGDKIYLSDPAEQPNSNE